MVELILKKEVFDIIGAAIEVHKIFGSGFLEAVYQEAFEIELKLREIPFESQRFLTVKYKERELSAKFKADLICFDQIVVELKALESLSGCEQAQIINYLKVTGMPVGLLINFGSSGKLEWKRFVN